MQLWDATKTMFNYGAGLLAAGAVVWAVASPMAAEFIKNKVDESVDTRFKKLEEAVDSLKTQQTQANVNAAVTTNDLSTLKQGQAEQRQDIKDILKGLKNSGIVNPNQ